MKPKRQKKAETFAELFAGMHRRQRERIRKVGKHQCVKTLFATVVRLYGRGGKLLKRPVKIGSYYECKICGRDMTNYHE